MKQFSVKRARGFSLLELLAAVAIVAILAAAATPLYRKHSQHLRSLDGKTKLLEVMGLEHRHYARTFTYTDDFAELGLTGDGSEIASDRAHYRLSAAACENDLAACVKLTAAPARDDDTTLTLNSRGHRTPPEAWR